MLIKNKHRLIPGDRVELELTQGLSTIIDLPDLPRAGLRKWYAVKSKGNSTYYAATNFSMLRDGKRGILYLHRYLLNTSKMVDHINRDGLDNCRINLREVTATESASNRGAHSDGLVPDAKGVSWDKRRRKWKTALHHEGRGVHCSHHDTIEEAKMAFDDVAGLFQGEHAFLNYPEHHPERFTPERKLDS
jgi:hypothetical protein